MNREVYWLKEDRQDGPSCRVHKGNSVGSIKEIRYYESKKLLRKQNLKA